MRLRRRELLTRGCAAASLPLAAAAAAAPAQARPDTSLLTELIAIEDEAGLLYGTLAGGRVPARVFREQSRAHARGLGVALRDRGGRPPAPRARVGRATPRQALKLEERALEAYGRVIGALRDERLLPTLAAAMANHAQHVVALRREVGGDPLPAAFPAGGVR